MLDPKKKSNNKQGKGNHFAESAEDVRDDINIKYVTGQGPKLEQYYAKPELKRRFEDIILELGNIDVFNTVGIPATKTYLMVGPPRTGKTFGVKVLAEELKQQSGLGQKIGMLQYKIGQSGSKYINVNASKINQLFEFGQELLSDPSRGIGYIVYFFDECDIVLKQRGGLHSHKEDDKVAVTIMDHQQRVTESKTNEIIFMATNFEDALDEAATSSGRTDEIIRFELPDYDARKIFIEGYMRELRENANYDMFPQTNIDNLAEVSSKFNISDMQIGIQKSFKNVLKDMLRKKGQGIISELKVEVPMEAIYSQFRAIKEKKGISNSGTIGFVHYKN